MKLFSPKLLTIGCWNIQGIYENINRVKINKLEDDLFLKTLKKFDILCLQETHIGPEDVPNVPDDYIPVPHCRSISSNNRYFGGMLLLIRKTIRGFVEVIQDFDQDLIEIILNKHAFNLSEEKRIIFVYASPFTSPYTKARDINILEKLETKDACCQNTLVMGDLNGRTKLGEDYVRDCIDKHCPADTPIYSRDRAMIRNNMDTSPIDQQGKLILSLCKSTGLRILNGRTYGDTDGKFTRYPTHKEKEKPSTIDYALCGKSFLLDIYSFLVLPFSDLSDHCCLSTSVKINREVAKAPFPDKNADDNLSIKVTPELDSCIFDPTRIEIFKSNIRLDENFPALETLVNQDRNTPENILESIKLANSVLVDAAKKSFLPKNRRGKPRKEKRGKIWYSRECASYKASLRKYGRKLSASPFDKNALHLFQNCKKNYKKVCRKAEKEYRLKMIDKLKNIQLTEDPKNYWNMIKKMNKWGNESKDDTDKIPPQIWHKYFQSLLNAKPTDSNSEQNESPFSFEPVLDGRISIAELKTALCDLKRRKLGPDGILSDYLKVFGETYASILLKMMNGLFTETIYPDTWNTNYLKPIYKKGDILDPDNYRGIAIGSAFAKLYSLILLNRLIQHIEDKRLISPNQIGFMKFFRTSDHNFLLQTLIEKSKSNKKKLYVAFIDFKKAYDTVNRSLLFDRLKELGINGLFYKNIVEMYKNTKYSIKTSNGCLEPILSNLGLRQGCPLSPMLFNLFIDDVANIFANPSDLDPVSLQGKSINHFLYADDLVLVSESPNGLQNCLSKLGIYAKSKSLTISIKKSKTMIFNPSGLFIRQKFHIGGEQLEPVDSFCYLGFEVKPSGITSHGASILIDKSLKALRPLQRAIANFQIPLDLSLRLFHALIEPIAMYNVENWSILTDKQSANLNADTLLGYIDKAPLDVLHRKILRYCLGVNNSSPNIAIYGDTGEIPLTIKGFTLLVNFWHHLNMLPEHSLANLALRENVEMRTKWLKTVEKIINIFNLSEHINSDSFKDLSKKIGREFYRTKWTDSLSTNEQSRVRFYKQINAEIKQSGYTFLPYYQRKAIAKLRCSNHVLEIEKGRHKKTLSENRLCKACNQNEIEDENHFLSSCPIYTTLREKHGYGTKTSKEIMQDDNPKNLSIFLTRAWKLRNKILEPETVSAL